MPSFVAASMTVWPFSTWTGRPSISRLMGMSVRGELVADHVRDRRLLGAVAAVLHAAALVVDVVLEFLAEHLHEGARGHRRRVTQRADGAALDVVGEVEQQLQVFLAALPMFDAVDDAIEPAGAFTARRALAAGFLEVEVREALGRAHHAGV